MTPAELRAWREGRKLSRRGAADILGLSERTLETLEYGRNATSALFPVLERLTLALDMIEGGDAIPEPSSLDEVMSNPHHRDGVAILVDLPRQPSPAVRINVTLPRDLIAAIDRVTDNRSRFLAEAARKRLQSV